MALGVLTDPALAGRLVRAAAILTSQAWTEALTAHFSDPLVARSGALRVGLRHLSVAERNVA